MVSIEAGSTTSNSSSPSVDALNYLHDLGCRRFVERQVVLVEIVDPPNRFASINQRNAGLRD